MPKQPETGVATNNNRKFFKLKISNRLNSLPDKDIRVLECFAGEGVLWDEVEKQFKHKIQRTRIDINYYPGQPNIVSDSLRLLKRLKLEKYDVIDLDSWGSPITHLEVIFKRNYKGIIHCTYCNPITITPVKLLAELYYGIERKLINKKPSLFAKELPAMLRNYLLVRGVKTINGHLSQTHNYFWFKLV